MLYADWMCSTCKHSKRATSRLLAFSPHRYLLFCCTLPCSPCYVWLYNYMIQKVQKGNKEERKRLSLMDNFCCVRPGIWIHDCGIKLEPANQIESLDNRYSPLVSNQYVISSYSDSPPFSSCLACYGAKCIFYCNIIIANVHILVVVSHLLIFIQSFHNENTFQIYVQIILDFL